MDAEIQSIYSFFLILSYTYSAAFLIVESMCSAQLYFAMLLTSKQIVTYCILGWFDVVGAMILHRVINIKAVMNLLSVLPPSNALVIVEQKFEYPMKP